MSQTPIQKASAPRSSIRLPRSLWERLDKIAAARGTSRNTDMLKALEAYALQAEREIQKKG